MKKLLTLSLIVCGFLTANVANAQVTFGMGPKVGLNLSSLSYKIDGESPAQAFNNAFPGSDYSASDFGIGAMGGIFAEAWFGETFGLAAEFQFSGEGSGTSYTEKGTGESAFDGDFDSMNRFKMMNIPIMAKVNIKGVDAFAGVQFSSVRARTFLFGTRSPDNKPTEIAEEDWMTEHKGSWTSIVVGAGKEVAGVTVDLKLTFASEIGTDPDSFSAKPFNLQIGIGYKVFGKRDDG